MKVMIHGMGAAYTTPTVIEYSLILGSTNVSSAYWLAISEQSFGIATQLLQLTMGVLGRFHSGIIWRHFDMNCL